MTWRDWLGLAKWTALIFAGMVVLALVVLAVIQNVKERLR
jgi:hypothetical protein